MSVNLAKTLLNNPGLISLTVAGEQEEIRVASKIAAKASKIRLQRTFNQKGLDGDITKYWRVNCPGHPNHGSDLSLQGLKDWAIL